MNNLSEKSIFRMRDHFSVHFQLHKKTFIFGMNQKTFIEETEHPERGKQGTNKRKQDRQKHIS